MPQEPAQLFHCVCGADLPFAVEGEIVCDRCGRRHHLSAMNPATMETVVLDQRVTKVAATSPVGAASSPVTGAPSIEGQSLDHFKVIRELGRGGAGTVYLALDTSLERYVALKVLDVHTDWALETFVHEARAQARVNHPGIATIYYVGRHADVLYFAMEYVPGEDLAVRVQRGPLPPGEVIRIGIQAVRALHDASAHGITHRDIKPGNFIRTPAGKIKLTDFGLSRTERGGIDIKDAASVTGTPLYIAPEQARGEPTDLRTDIYSLGATLYHLTFGKAPFEGATVGEVIRKHQEEDLQFPDPLPPDVPQGLTEVLSKMMAKRPADRFADYESLERALRDLLPESQTVASGFRRAIATALELAGVIALSALSEGLFDLGQYLLGREQGGIDIADITSATMLAALFLLQIVTRCTPGKSFMHIKIASISYGPPHRAKLALRWCLQWLPMIVINVRPFLEWFVSVRNFWIIAATIFWLIDLLWGFTNRKRRTLRDVATGTWVLEDRPMLDIL